MLIADIHTSFFARESATHFLITSALSDTASTIAPIALMTFMYISRQFYSVIFATITLETFETASAKGRAIAKSTIKARVHISKKLEVKPTLTKLMDSDMQNTIVATIMPMIRK
jgi:hypothetical protein